MGRIGIFLLGTLLLLTQAEVCESVCPSPWTLTRHGCYVVIKGKQNWRNAQLTCEALGSGLAIITSDEENESVRSMLKAVAGEGEKETTAGWIGLHDMKVEGHFQWINHHPPIEYDNWYPGEPNNANGTWQEDCVEMYAGQGTWNDRWCLAENYFICEKKNPSQIPERITLLEDKCK